MDSPTVPRYPSSMRRERAKSREGMIGSTFWLAEGLHQKVARAALDDRKAIAVVVREALRLWLAERRKRRKRP